MRLYIELSLQLLARTTHSGTGRITRLSHEAIDHTVKGHSVIEAARGKFFNPCNMVGC